MKHTATPWKIVSHPVFNSPIIMGEISDKPFRTHPSFDEPIPFGKGIAELVDVRGDGFERLESGEQKANAELIVKAVNNHDALVQFVQSMLDESINVLSEMSDAELKNRMEARTLINKLKNG